MLDEYMKEIGYSTEQIELIEDSYPLKSYAESTLLYCMKNLVNYLHRNTFDNSDIISITTTIPQIISMSIEEIKIKITEFIDHSISKINIYQMIKEYPYIIEMSIQRIRNKYQIFEELGFTLSSTNNIFIHCPSILNVDPSSIRNHYQFFKDYGYKQDEIHTIFETIPQLFLLSTTKIQKRLEEYSAIGFKKDEIVKITYYLPEGLIIEKEEIMNRLKFMGDYGYQLNDIITIIKSVPMILSDYFTSSLEEKWLVLEEIGFSKDDVVSITKQNPYLLLYSKELLKDNYTHFVKRGFYHKEVLEMIKDTPLLLGFHKNNIDKKLDAYKDFGLFDYIKNHSSCLLCSLNYILKRKKYIKNNEWEDLFLNDVDFHKKYKVTRKQIIGG